MFMDRKAQYYRDFNSPKLIHLIYFIPVRTCVFFEDIDKMILKLTWKGKGT